MLKALLSRRGPIYLSFRLVIDLTPILLSFIILTGGASIVVLVFTFLTEASGSLTCLSCKDVPKAEDCKTVEFCGTNSVCFIEQFVTQKGYILFTMGCRDILQCQKSQSGRSIRATDISTAIQRKRRNNNLMVCTDCCHTDLCNNVGCHSKGFTQPHGTICFACSAFLREGSCDTIRICGRDESCYIGRYTTPTDVIYSSGCLSKTKCISQGIFHPLIGRDVGSNLVKKYSSVQRRNVPSKEHCCDRQLCNIFVAVDGGWTTWSSWSKCSTSCGFSGFRSRTKKCTSPAPAHGGLPCQGVGIDYDTTCSNVKCSNELLCLSCQDAPLPRDCNKVERCGPHSVCYLEKYISPNGFATFYSGCRDKMTCRAQINGKRFLMGSSNLICSECCTTSLCNSAGCNAPGYPPGIGPICYSCQQQLNPYQCDTIEICKAGQNDPSYCNGIIDGMDGRPGPEVCSMNQQFNGIHNLYHTGCSNNTTCSNGGTCPRCCSSTLCNNVGCNVTQPTTSTPLTSSPTVTATRATKSPVTTQSTPTTKSTVTTRTTLTTKSTVTTKSTHTFHQTTKVPSHWEAWHAWSSCSVTCGSGVQLRNRTCTLTGNSACTGRGDAVKTCTLPACHVNPVSVGWGPWSPWSACDQTDYSQGVRIRTRLCSDIFQLCPGSTTVIDTDQKYCIGNMSLHCSDPVVKVSVTGKWKVGDRVVLHCTATGNPVPEVVWKIHTEENVQRIKGDPGTLIIDHVTPTHNGLFECEASNQCYMASKELLNITVIP